MRRGGQKITFILFTIFNDMCYNLSVKKFLCLTTSLCAAVGALGLGSSLLAFADSSAGAGLDYYPSSFLDVPAFDNLEDYAVGNDKVLFLQENTVYEYGNENVVKYENSRKTITALYFESGEFYYGTNDGTVYALKNFHAEENPEVEDFNSTTETNEFTLNGAYYHYDGNEIFVLKDHIDTKLEGFSNLKLYGDTVYAVKENVLYTLDGSAETPVQVENFYLTNKIKTGGAYEALTTHAQNELEFVSLSPDRYMTEVDLDKLTETSEFFEAGGTVKINVGDTPTALLLYTAGDRQNGLSLIAVNGKAYILHPASTSPKTVYALQESDYKDGTITMGYVYSAPFESGGTRITGLVSGVTVKILGEVRKDANAELKDDFYLIEYTDGENTVKGYVRFGLLSTFTFNEDPPQTTPDPGETYDDLVKPVILVLIVLLLIAIAVGYLVYLGTSGKRKQKKPDDKDKS